MVVLLILLLTRRLQKSERTPYKTLRMCLWAISFLRKRRLCQMRSDVAEYDGVMTEQRQSRGSSFETVTLVSTATTRLKACE